jgi:hypothetical protein
LVKIKDFELHVFTEEYAWAIAWAIAVAFPPPELTAWASACRLRNALLRLLGNFNDLGISKK